jgi:ketosteroid isomerase-like protein
MPGTVMALMACMTHDCVFENAGGPAKFGTRFEVQQAVRQGFTGVWESVPDAQWLQVRHFIAGNRGVSEWTFTGTTREGKKMEVNGCDVLTFRDGKIFIKDSYTKNRPPTN